MSSQKVESEANDKHRGGNPRAGSLTREQRSPTMIPDEE